jgi:acyl-CoA thioesterase FadM
MTAATVDDVLTFDLGRPRYGSANIRTWIGFKEFARLVEEAVLDWFRDHEFGPRRLYHEYGLGLEITDAALQLPAVLETDDRVAGEVTVRGPGRFAVKLRVEREGTPVVVAKGRIAVCLVREADAPTECTVPPALATFVVPNVAAAPSAANGSDGDSRSAPALTWPWEARYFHCHYSDRVQHSAYVAALEEIVDRFLADRGLGVPELLESRGWIPVVSKVRVELLADAHMGERIQSTFGVDSIIGDVAFDGRMDCYVNRGGKAVPTATARILHGYAVSRGPDAGRLATLDDEVIAALTGGGR